MASKKRVRRYHPPLGESISYFIKNAWRSAISLAETFIKEKIVTYLVIIVILTIICGFIFMYVERDVIQATIDSNSILSKPATPFTKILTSIYWANVTFASLGYGDIYPKTTAGRVMVIITVYLAMASVGLFTAALTSTLTAQKLRKGFGMTDYSHMKEHYVICGWKKNMNMVLNDILKANETLHIADVLIIAKLEAETVDTFLSHYPEYKQLNIIRGDYSNESILHAAGVANASKIFILADETGSASQSEVDSKTVITAMTLSTIAKTVSVCAEIYDPAFTDYLHRYHIDEIIYLGDYPRLILANAVRSIGYVKIMNDLLDTEEGGVISTEPIKNEFVGKPYSDLRSWYFSNKPAHTLIGLLLNVGNFQEMRHEALREAQKTGDIPKLVENLNRVKELETNKPMIAPPDNTVVESDTYAILIIPSEDYHER